MSTPRTHYRPRAVRIAIVPTAPGVYPAFTAGQCTDCAPLGGWLCRSCQTDQAANDRQHSATMRLVCRGIRANAVAELCARNEIESDESGTREDRAARMLGAESFAAYVAA